MTIEEQVLLVELVAKIFQLFFVIVLRFALFWHYFILHVDAIYTIDIVALFQDGL